MRQEYVKNVATIQLDPARCTGCGTCLEVCPHGVFFVEAGNGQRSGIRDRDLCMECGACARNCPAGAITVRAGVGCAWAIVRGRLTGKEPTCGCGDASGPGSTCCG